MSPQELERFEDLKAKSRRIPRVTYTELARGKEWREELPECGIIEVVDRSETSAWLVTDEYLYGIISLVDELLDEREERQIQDMLAAREGYQDWREGEDLASVAKASLHARLDEMKAAAHVD